MAEERTERRRSPRYAVHGVRGWLTLHSEARVLNLSLTGMSVETVHPLEVGKGYTIRLAHGDLDLRLGGTAVRSRLRGTRKHGPGAGGDAVPVYESGIRFDDALGDKAELLHRLLGAGTEVSLERRITGRFELGLPESVRLRRDYQFEVLKISATGMLIETELAPRLDSVFEIGVALGGEELRSACRVAFVEPAAGGRHHLGVEFRDVSAADRRRLEEFLAREAAGGAPAS